MATTTIQPKSTVEKLDGIASTVARYLALGLDYEDISVATGLPVDNVAKVARGNLVKRRTRELQKEIDERVVEDAAADPVALYLKGKSMVAAKTLVSEAENYDKEDQGATASTRISASKEILNLAGYKGQSEEQGAGTVIQISAEKVDIAQQIIQNKEQKIQDMPDFVDG